MKIALLAPIEESVPPKKYGGTERVVFNLAEELVKLGHEVSLFASADSKTSAKLIPVANRSIRKYMTTNPRVWLDEQIKALHIALELIGKNRFDIIHNHLDAPLLIFRKLVKVPIVTTIHNPVDYSLKNSYLSQNFVSISRAQRRYAPDLNYLATVHNGINVDEFVFNDKPKNYLAFLGRISPDKGPKQAIEIAKKSGHRLIMGAKVDPVDRAYYRKVIKPLVNNKNVVFLGEVDAKAKNDLLKNAKALLSPIQWDEPFGLATVEALSCGTPVLTYKRGSMSEIISDGKNGFLCENESDMLRAITKIGKIDRQFCRADVAKRFSASLMAKRYVKVYEKAIAA
ncbi:MAG TPA: glycosyltransferase family 4 protein [Candidatus Saccharimonadales bacterium]|nr:glycosyltransferase family 4 protein [Candidatus Saccharimonadales bacterium]